MNKVVFFERNGKVIPVKVTCRETDTEEQFENKANKELMKFVDEDLDILDYEIKEIRLLN